MKNITFPFANEHAARIIDPGKFEKDSFRRKNITKGVDIIIGRLKGKTTTTTQAYRFDDKIFTVAQAKKWLRDHDIKWILFEKSTGKDKDMSQKFTISIDEIEAFKPGLTPDEKIRYTEIVQNLTGKCIEAGGGVMQCEIEAISSANAQFSDGKGKALSQARPIEDLLKDSKDGLQIALQEVDNEIPKDQKISDWQKVLPVGTFFLNFWGETIITPIFVENIVKNFNDKNISPTDPFLDKNHNREIACGWITEMEARRDGLFVKFEWTEIGFDAISKRLYRYYSADLMQVVNIKTNENVWPVLRAVALTNIPAMTTLPEATLSDAAQRDGKNNNEDNNMTKEEYITYSKEVRLSDEEKNTVAGNMKFDNGSEKILTLSNENEGLKNDLNKAKGESDTRKDTNQALAARVETLETSIQAGNREKVIGLALSEGRIVPADKEKWEKRFNDNPNTTEEILNELPKKVDLSEKGHSKNSQSGNITLSVDDKKMADILKIPEKEYLEEMNKLPEEN